MKPITDITQLDLNKHYTYADYLSWKIEERLEIIRGRIFKLAAPRRKHQEVSAELFIQLKIHLKGVFSIII